MAAAGNNGGNTQGEKMTIKLDWKLVRRRGRQYLYPRLVLPSRVVEELGLTPGEKIDVEVEIEQRNGEKVIVIRPLVKR